MFFYIGLREPPGDGEIKEVTLPSRHKNRNSSPGGLRPSTLRSRRLTENIECSGVSREETYFFFEI